MRVLTEGFFERFYKDKPQVPKTFRFSSSTSNALATLSLLYQVPVGYDFILTSASILGLAGAGQNTLECTIDTLVAGGAFSVVFIQEVFAVVRQKNVMNFVGSMYVPSQHYVRSIISFDAGVAVNNAGASLMGFLVPPAGLLSG